MFGRPEDLEVARKAEVSGLVQRRDAGMLDILGAEDRDRLPLSISFEDPGDLEHGERAPSFLGDERNGVRSADALGLLVGEREGDRDRPGEAVLQVHRLEDRAVVPFAYEASQGRERPHREHLQVGQLPLVDGDLGPVLGLTLEDSASGPVTRRSTSVPPWARWGRSASCG